MNIFVFHKCPVRSAICQPDKMLVKMVLETAQMLCTAHRELDGDTNAEQLGLYQTVHVNHPCTKWARECSSNYSWLYKHFLALGNEYTNRYDKVHSSISNLASVLREYPKNIVRSTKTTEHAQAMPIIYKHSDPRVAYRRYCIAEKHYAKWQRGRQKPIWWN